MTRYLISGVLGPEDPFEPKDSGETVVASLDLLDSNGNLRFGIGGALYQLAAMELAPTPIGIDLLTLAALVHAADTRLNRIRTSQDAWTREIGIILPVSDVVVWNPAVEVIERMLRFLTGDLWTVRFRSLPASGRPPLRRRPRMTTARHFEGVSLLSGGLDSLIGALDELHGGGRPLFVSHGGEGGVSGPQRKLFEMLKETGLGTQELTRLRLAMIFPRSLVPGVGSENSTRGRSFLFIALGAFAGSAFGRPFTLRVPENGLISLNVPLDVTRLGSNSTRTTHPFYIHRWNEFLARIGVPATVTNPYWKRTKGEIVAECKEPGILEKLAPYSLSCAHPSMKRWHEGGKPHCGYCLPCIIRRASLLKAPWANKDQTGYSVPELADEVLDTTKAKGRQVRGFQYAVARLKERPGLAKMWIYKPGPLREDAAIVPDLVGVYERGMAEVATVLEGVVAKPVDNPGA